VWDGGRMAGNKAPPCSVGSRDNGDDSPPSAWPASRRRRTSARIRGASASSQLLPRWSSGGAPWRCWNGSLSVRRARRSQPPPGQHGQQGSSPVRLAGRCCDRPGAGRALGDGGQTPGSYNGKAAWEGRDRRTTVCRYPSRVMLAYSLAHKTGARSATKARRSSTQ